MHALVTLLVLVPLIQANPLLVPRQAVTEAIAPSAAAPPGCSASVAGSFGIAVQRLSGNEKRQAATQIAEYD